jgi:uncharacterized protein YuzE
MKAANVHDLNLSERYDPEDDIYYVTLQTGEPSLVMEHDDRLLFEVGVFTGTLTGFRILRYSKYKAQASEFKEIFCRACKEADVRNVKDAQARNRRLVQALESVAS